MGVDQESTGLYYGASRTQVSAAGAALWDVRPILDRRRDSIWARVEKKRDDICEELRRACENEGFDAQVIKSMHFEQPAWVKLEC